MALNELSELTGLEDRLMTRSDDLPSTFSSKSFQIDFENGRILSNLLSPGETVRQQAGIEFMTERGSHTVLGEDFGAEFSEIIARAVTPEVAIADITHEINEVLFSYPQISEVTDLSVELLGGDKLRFEAEITVDGETTTIRQEIDRA